MFSKGLVVFKKSQLTALARDMVKTELTVVPLPSERTEILKPIVLYQEIGDEIAVPRGYFQEVILKRFDPEAVINFSIGRNELKPCQEIVYREGQRETIDECVKVLKSKSYSGVIVEAKTGSGKTPITLEIARRLGHKTLVIVHTSVLFDQWMQEIKNIMPSWSVGAVQGQTVDVENNDICVGMLQSLALKKDYSEKFFEEFGTIIADEVHLMGCEEFHKALIRFCPQYIIGASGTFKRKDRAENVIRYCIGSVVSAMGKIPSLDPKIYLVDTKYLFSSGVNQGTLRDDIINNDERNALIVMNAERAALSGRQVLILTNRVSHAETLYRALVNKLIKKNISVGIMVGQTDDSVRQLSQKSNVIVATTQLVSVGFNEPRLDTLIMANPLADNVLEQGIGRILRIYPEKKQPMVIDFVDTSYPAAWSLARKRYEVYSEKEWEVVGSECLGYGKVKSLFRVNGGKSAKTIRRSSS